MSVDLFAGWVAGLDDVMARIAGRFGRVEPRRRARGYLCYGPDDTTDDDLIRVAGTRWAVEECFQTAKNEVGLDDGHVSPAPRQISAPDFVPSGVQSARRRACGSPA